jgi:diguanylate cyclase (GGDEF)-like protein
MSKDMSDTDQEAMESSRKPHDSLIMMVDDEPILMAVIEEFLGEAGYENFLAVEDSTKALAILRERQPDVLLLDLVMPEVDGFEILHEVRAHLDTRHLPVIVLTSSSDAATKLRALELGATDFLAKPVDSSELVLRLRNTLTVKAYQDQLAFYDTLTGLPNRTLFTDRLKWALQHADRTRKSAAVLNIDLDRFKNINDTLGPRIGDALLAQVASRLTDCIRMDAYINYSDRAELSSSVSRLGGDEFSVILHEISRVENASYVARRLTQSMVDPFYIDEHEIFLSTSIGIALYPEDGLEVDTLMKNVAVATEFAKQQGRNNYQFYSEQLNARSEERLKLETDLRRAIERGQLEIYYQPKIEGISGRVSGMEALIRWHRSEHGTILPSEFIPVAEQMGQIVIMGNWLLNDVCRQHREWMEDGLGPLKVSVNVSGHQFSDIDLCRFLRDALNKHKMDASSLILEITESVLMGDVEGSIQTMHEIKELGLALSIDDFGTGYSSLSYLKQFPVEELKIDRSFIMDLPESRDDKAIVRAIIALADGLDLDVVAEGVETEQQLNFLNENGCGTIQGYYFSKPLPAAEFKQFVLERNAS